MRITWRDGVTTLATAGAVVLERAYFHDWDWPLVSSMRWVISGLLTLVAVNFVFGYMLDAVRGELWSVTAIAFVLAAATLAGFGLYYVDSDYVVLLMAANVVFWVTSIARHLTVHVPMSHSHA